MAQRIIPNIWFTRDAEEAATFYTSVFNGATAIVGAHYPSELPDWQAEFAGRVLTIDLVIDNFLITLVNAGDEFSPNPSISFMLNFDPLFFGGETDAARRRLDEVWTGLGEGGTVMMELGEYPFSPRYGWVQDRFGVSWQLLLTDPDGPPQPFVIPQLMFGGGAQGRAREAVEFYTSLFEDSGVAFLAPYEEDTGPAKTGDVIFGAFQLAGQAFAAMDSAVEQDFSFTPGISLEVRCEDQAEIDRLWDALSAAPEAEQCGWLADRFGVSWQIVPTDMGELMSRPGAYEAMLEMKKLVIADFPPA